MILTGGGSTTRPKLVHPPQDLMLLDAGLSFSALPRSLRIGLAVARGIVALMSGSTQLELLLPECRAYARAICSRRDEAEDLVQDAMVRALGASQQPDRVEELRPWLFRVIRNLYYDELRRRRVRRAYLNLENYVSNGIYAGPDQERDVMIRHAFAQLPADSREVLFLVDIVGLKYKEAAEVMNVPSGTVMSRISRARRAMLNRLEGDGEQTIQGLNRS